MRTDAPPGGLTQAQVLERRRAGLGNTVRDRASRSYRQVLRTNVFTFFNNILFVIGGALLALGRTNDAVISVGLGLVNAVIGTVQEARSKRTLDRLRLLHRSQSTVVRDGRERSVPPEELVQGDLLRIAAGDQVVVDGPVVGPGRLEVDESLLTGESDPVVKTAGDGLLSGTSCVSGTALQRATEVGGASHAATLTAAARTWTPQQTPLQRQIGLVVRVAMLLVALMSAAIGLQAVLEGLTLLRVAQISAVLSGLVPYGLFFLVSASYAVGAAALGRQGVMVQQLNAVESLSNVDVVCTDKTGTLTTGRLALQDVLPCGPDPTVAAALLGCVARSTTAGNATTAALVAGLPGTAAPVLGEVPFSSARRWSGVSLDLPQRGVFVLGAVEALRPALVGADHGGLDAEVARRSREGLRVLLFARADGGAASLYGDDGQPALPPLAPLALVVLSDELRPGVEQTVESFRRRGVGVKVVSGDDPRTVAAIVARLGLRDDTPVTGAELAGLSPAAFDDAVAARTVFGRIAPEQKEQIVDALRRQGRYVAMIGDGVNDARCLKRAQVGIAMQSGSSVTRDVADIVLLNDSFTALEPAQAAGRRIIAGISRSLHLFLTRALTSMLVIVGVSVLGIGFPYEPAQVGLTLFTVGLPALLLTSWAPPEAPDPQLLSRVARFVLPAAVVTAMFAVGLYAAFFTLVDSGLSQGLLPADAVRGLEDFTGLAGNDSSFTTAAATGVAQTVLSMFTSVTAFALLLFLAPPSRLFTGWTAVVRDKRPALLAAGLLAAFLLVLLVPATAHYFALLRPSGPEVPIVGVTAVAWFFVLRTCWRRAVLERLLGLPLPTAP